MNRLENTIFESWRGLKMFRKAFVYVIILSLLWQNCLWATGGFHIIEEDLDASRTRVYGGGKVEFVEPGVVKNGAVHNVFEDLQLLEGRGFVFKSDPDAEAIYNRIYSQNPIHLSGIIDSDKTQPMVFANPGELFLRIQILVTLMI